MRTALRVFVITAAAALAGCATSPDAIPDPGRDSPSLADVRQAPEDYRGERVRWGGTIAGVENRADTTVVEVVARELERDGRPTDTDGSPGRFLAVVDGFLDPAIHEKGRSFTVTGTVAGTESRRVGEHDYEYVRVDASGHHLWSQREPVRAARYSHHGHWPFHHPFHDPFFHPFHPHGHHYY